MGNEQNMMGLTTAKDNLPAEMTGSWGAEDADAADIVIPRLMLMQGLSDFVKERKARAGDIINSLTQKVIGDFEHPVELIPIMRASKEWLVDEELQPRTWSFKERITWTPANAEWDKSRETTINGVNTRRTLCLNYFFLQPTDLQGLPILVSFRKTSFRTGQNLSTYFTDCKMKNQPPAARVMALGCHERSKDKNSWFVFDLTEKRESNHEELRAAYLWFKTLKEIKVKVDESEDKVDAAQGEEVPF